MPGIDQGLSEKDSGSRKQKPGSMANPETDIRAIDVAKKNDIKARRYMAHLHIGSCMYVHMYVCMYVQYVFMYMYKHAEGCRLKACQFTVFIPQRRRCTVLIIQLVLHKVCIDINIMNDGKPHAKLPFLLSPSASTFALPFRLLTLLMPKGEKRIQR